MNLGSSERVSKIQSVLRPRSVPGVGTRALWRILNRFGSGRRALAARPVELDAVAGMRCSEALASPGLESRVRDGLDRCRTPALAILLWSDDDTRRGWVTSSTRRLSCSRGGGSNYSGDPQ